MAENSGTKIQTITAELRNVKKDILELQQKENILYSDLMKEIASFFMQQLSEQVLSKTE